MNKEQEYLSKQKEILAFKTQTEKKTDSKKEIETSANSWHALNEATMGKRRKSINSRNVDLLMKCPLASPGMPGIIETLFSKK